MVDLLSTLKTVALFYYWPAVNKKISMPKDLTIDMTFKIVMVKVIELTKKTIYY